MKKIISIGVALLFIIVLTAATLATTLAATAMESSLFADVDSSERYHKGIEFLANSGIINGYPDGTYQPTRTLNRAEMMKIIAEGRAIYSGWGDDAFDSYANQECFNDVPAGQWFTKYACYGKAQGWVIGYSDGTFKPSQTVTFAESLKITFKGFGLPYSESGSVWYRDVVVSASEENYIPFDITGFSAGLKRNQMADMVARILKAEESEGAFNEYLGERADIVVTYDTIEAGQDLMELEFEELDTSDDDSTVGMSESEADPEAEPTGPQTHTVTMDQNGFSPQNLDITAGDTVIFSNNGTTLRWPASNNHPTHTLYPGSGNSACGSGQENFDACTGLEQNQSFEFTFNAIGSWGYHDHISPSLGGIIAVHEE